MGHSALVSARERFTSNLEGARERLLDGFRSYHRRGRREKTNVPARDPVKLIAIPLFGPRGDGLRDTYLVRYPYGDLRLGVTTQMIAVGSPKWSGTLFRGLLDAKQLETLEREWKELVKSAGSPEHAVRQAEAHVAHLLGLKESDLPTLLLMPSAAGWWKQDLKAEETIVTCDANGLLRIATPYDAMTALLDSLDSQRIMDLIREHKNCDAKPWRDVALQILAPLRERAGVSRGAESQGWFADASRTVEDRIEIAASRRVLEDEFRLTRLELIWLLATISRGAGRWSGKALQSAAGLGRTQLSKYVGYLRTHQPEPLVGSERGYPLTDAGERAAEYARQIAREQPRPPRRRSRRAR